jgi:hemerythrin superfamily protein
MAKQQMDGLEQLIQDHRAVDEMFTMIEQAMGEDAEKVQELTQEVIQSLALHSELEETFLYPVMREIVGDDKTDEAIAEHEEVDEIMDRLQVMVPEDDDFPTTCSELMDGVRHHVEEEENELFPQLREALDEQRLRQMGREMLRAKQGAQQQA